MLGFLLSYLLIYKYAAIFLIVLIAAIIVPLPVNTMLLAVGAFASQGYFNFWICLITAVTANMTGDLFDYFITREYGQRFIKSYYNKQISYFNYIEKYMREHAGLTIYLTRFAGILDITGNFLAGLTGVPLRTFIIADFLGNFSIFFPILSFGYLAGNYWQNFSSTLSIMSNIVLVIIVIYFTYRFFHYFNKRRKLKKKTKID